MTADEVTGVTPESQQFCADLIKDAVFGSLYTPIGLKRTVLFPGTNGGANWGGASFDPDSRTLYVNSMDVGMVFQMMARRRGPSSRSAPGAPLLRVPDSGITISTRARSPPGAHLTAINLDTGEFRWRTVLGVVDALIAKGLPPTGAPNLGGSIVTAGGLVFIAATNDSRFRAFDKDTGRKLMVTQTSRQWHATP